MKAALKRTIRRIIGDPPVLLEEMPNCPHIFEYYRDLLATGHKRVPGGWLYDEHFYPDHITVGGAIYGALEHAKKYCEGEGLDIGAGLWPFPGATPIDLAYGPEGTKLADIPDGTQDYVFSSHTLEHIEDWQSALREWIGKVKSGGSIFLYLPHPTCGLWRKDNPYMARYHKWVPTPPVVKQALQLNGCDLLACDDGPDIMFSFHVCGIKRESLVSEARPIP